MRVGVLCPGPSLGTGPTPTGYDLLIGVNRAVLWRACDWWAFIDWPLFRRVIEEDGGPLGSPRAFTMSPSALAIGKHGLNDRYQAMSPMLVEELPSYDRGVERFYCGKQLLFSWWQFTAPSAVMLAVHLGATRVDMHGADMQGREDADGRVDEGDRSDRRWREREWPTLSMAVGYARDHGCEVYRTFPADRPLWSN